MFKQRSIILCLLLLLAATIVAEPKRVSVEVEGLACPFCTYNLEKRIKTLDGVPKDIKWKASVKQGTVRFDWQEDVPFNEDAVREQIRKAGFTAGKIKIDPDASVSEGEKVDYVAP